MRYKYTRFVLFLLELLRFDTLPEILILVAVPGAMFNFMKKSNVLTGDSGGYEERDGEKERRKKEKKERKEREKRERIAAGLEEPLRLEEVGCYYHQYLVYNLFGFTR